MKFIRRPVKTLLIVGVIAFGLAIWTVKPFVDQWRANRLVDELCRVDGGIKVYEVAPGNPMAVRPKRLRNEGDEFYYVMTTKDILGNSNSSDISARTVYRTETGVYRAKDDKLLGTGVHYVRRGGDPYWPFHPSAYVCPSRAADQDVTRRVIVQKKG